MKAFVVLAAVLACTSAQQVVLSNGLLGLQGIQTGAIAYNNVIAAPAISYAVPAVTKTQYHSQDELGQASFGYAHPGQAHAAVRDAAGNVRGSYAYVNPEGKEVRVEYSAGHNGVQIASNALPVSPVHVPVQPVANLVAPAAVQETPEVIQARAAHALAHQQALARSGRKKRAVVSVLPSTLGYSNIVSPVSALGYSSVVSPVSTIGYSSVIGNQVVASPIGLSAVSPVSVVAPQAVRSATLTKVVNTPGHAVSYRVD